MADDRQLDNRKAAILRAVVQQYIETAQPVGSSTVSAREDVAVSSATVRNEMTQLERDGYLVQPHTSAGRVPTEKGYRFFVDNLSGPGQMNPSNLRLVREFFATTHGELEQMLSETSRLLSNVTGTAAVVMGEAHDVATIRSIQLVDLSAKTVLAIVVNLGIGTVAGLLTDASPGDPDLVLALGVAIGQLFTTPFSVLVITALLFACLADERPFDAAKQLRYVHALDR